MRQDDSSIKTYISTSSLFQVCDSDRLIQHVGVVSVQAFRLLDGEIFTLVDQV